MGYTMYNMEATGRAFAPPDRIVADLDGTLTSVGSLTAKIASVSDRWNMSVSAALLRTYDHFIKTYYGIGLSHTMLESFKASVMGTIVHEQEDTPFFLFAAAANNIPCTILSNGPQKWGRYILAMTGMDIFIDKAFFREDIPHLKPDPRSLQALFEDEAHLQASQIWVYGDRSTDAELAWNASKEMDHTFIPVAVEGTNAATAIRKACTTYQYRKGIVFDQQFDLAKALNPDFEKNFVNFTRPPRHHHEIVASRPSP